MSEIIKLFIDGQRREGSDKETLAVINPATEEKIADLCLANEKDLKETLAAANKGFAIWRNKPADERAMLLHQTAKRIRERGGEIASVLTREQGKTLSQSIWEINTTANYFDDLAECGLRVAGKVLAPESSGIRRSIVYEPVGPVFAVSPWNLPVMMPGRKIATSLAAGCSIIVKPAKETPQTAYLIAECCQSAGIPDGVVNIISGDSSLISNTLIKSPIISKVSFTGSTEVGKELAQIAGAYMKKTSMELGGHAPVIVCEDVDVEMVVNMTVPARYSNAGQSCMAATRFFVHDAIYEKFVHAFTKKVKGLRVGNGADEGVDMGPLTSARRIPMVKSLIDDALEKGAKLMCGGSSLPGPGFYFEPTVLCDVPDEARLMFEEPFGPVSPITRFSGLDDVIERANSTPYGLASYVFTHNLERANILSNSLQAGLVGINTMNIAGVTVPFGGVKDSGIGREGAIEGVLESMTIKTVSMAL